jgi:hypothetical protein
MLWIPIAALSALVVSLVAGAGKKHAAQAQQHATGELDEQYPNGTPPQVQLPQVQLPQVQLPTIPAPPAGSTALSPPLPADIAGLLNAAVGSGDVRIMQAAADKLRAQYPSQAAQLDALVKEVQDRIAQAKGAPAPTQLPAATQTPGIAYKAPAATPPFIPAVPVVPAGLPTPQQILTGAGAGNFQPAIDAARTLARANGIELTVADIANILNGGTYHLPGGGTPAQPLPQVTQLPGKALASQLALALKFAKKGQSSEPVQLVKDFQAAEGLGVDGHYDSNVAITLAKKYDIVPPQPPMYWGKKNNYASIAPDKTNYRATLNALAASEPQRKDEWLKAASSTPK